MHARALPATLILALAAPWTAAPAQTTTPKKPAPTSRPGKLPPAKLDELATKTIAKWRKMHYHLGRAGVRTIRFRMHVQSKGGMTGTWKATATYIWKAADKDDGKLAWEDDEVAAAMRRRGFTARYFARALHEDGLLRDLAGKRLEGVAFPKGTILAISGPGQREERSLLFAKDGRLIGQVVGPMKKAIHFDEQTKDKKLLYTGDTFRMPNTKGLVRVTHRSVLGFFVPVRMTELVHVRKKLLSDLTFRFDGYRINGKSQPAAKPASRPARKPGGRR